MLKIKVNKIVKFKDIPEHIVKNFINDYPISTKQEIISKYGFSAGKIKYIAGRLNLCQNAEIRSRRRTDLFKYVIQLCDCGNPQKLTIEQSKHKHYCSNECFYKYRKRPKGLKYDLKVINSAWWDTGHIPWNINKKCDFGHRWQKGEHSSPETEFKYINGNGYRHLLKRGILPQKCNKCSETRLCRLHVHHVDRDRTNNSIDNLLVLCRKHHLQLHGRKERHYVEGGKIVCKNV